MKQCFPGIASVSGMTFQGATLRLGDLELAGDPVATLAQPNKVGIALHDRDHIHHERAALWLEANISHGWASCPLTQNGVLRIMSQAGYSSPQPLAVLINMLHNSTSTPHHAFWSDEISLLDAAHFQHSHLHGPRQLTDVCLLALAIKNGGRLVGFDQRLPLTAVRGATPDHLVAL